jgi:hypothetical protein
MDDDHYAVKYCWAAPNQPTEGYILDNVAGNEGNSDPSFTFVKGFPKKVEEGYTTVLDPLNDKWVATSTRLHRHQVRPGQYEL